MTADSQQSVPVATLDEDRVIEFLSNNGDFLSRHPELLSKLEVHHEVGDAASLLERQVSILRDRNTSLHKRLGTLITNAKANDATFTRISAFTLALMDTTSIVELDQVLASNLIAEFDADHAICFIRGWTSSHQLEHVTAVGMDDEPPLARLFEREQPDCAICRPDEYARLFAGANLDGPGSMMLLPVGANAKPRAGGDGASAPGTTPGRSATLVIGSSNPERFTSDLGKMFLYYMGEVMFRTLTRLDIE